MPVLGLFGANPTTVITQPVGHQNDVSGPWIFEQVLPKLAWYIMFFTFIATYIQVFK